MNTLRTVLPETLVSHAEKVYDLGKKGVDKVHAGLVQGREFLTTQVNAHVPERLKELALRIVYAIPETLFCFALATDFGTSVAALFWTVRVIWVLGPIVGGIIESKSLEGAGTRLTEAFKGIYERFKPAIMVSSAAASCALLIYSVVGLNLTAFLYSACFAAVSLLAYEALPLPVPTATPNKSLSVDPAVD